MADYSITINGLLLQRPGFCVARDLTDLLTKGPFRGSNFVAQGVTGSTFRPKVRGEMRALASFRVFGALDSTGVPHAVPKWAGIRANLEAIEAACVDASASALVTASITYPDLVTRSAQVECPRLDAELADGDLSGAAVTAVLEVVIPAGALA